MIHQFFTGGPLRNFNYIIEGETGLYLIDPLYPQQVEHEVKKWGGPVLAIISTHEHYDHVAGNEELRALYDCPLWAHREARGKIKGVDRYLDDGESIGLGERAAMEVLFTPGHTMCHLSLIVADKAGASLLSGDTLFAAGVGNCHNGGDPSVLFETYRDRVSRLDSELKIFPGHDYLENNLLFSLSVNPQNKEAAEWLEKVRAKAEGEFLVTTLRDERAFNPFLRLSDQQMRETMGLAKTASEREVFLELRSRRNRW